MAKLVKIVPLACGECGSVATVSLLDWSGRSLGVFCSEHGLVKLTARDAWEKANPNEDPRPR